MLCAKTNILHLWLAMLKGKNLRFEKVKKSYKVTERRDFRFFPTKAKTRRVCNHRISFFLKSKVLNICCPEINQ